MRIAHTPTDIATECRQALQGPGGIEAAISLARDKGLSKVKSIIAIRQVTGKSLAEAKEAVHNSQTWADRKASDDDFHREVIEAVGLDREPAESLVDQALDEQVGLRSEYGA